MLNGIQIFVSEEIYKVYWKETNRERYLKRLDWKYGLIHLSNYDTPESQYINNITDSSIDIEMGIIMKECLDNLYYALSTLSHRDLALIYSIYFQGMSIRECAKLYNVSNKKITNARNKILEKLKNKLEYI